MKKTLSAVAVAGMILAGQAVPANAAGFAAKESWSHGADGITAFANSATCDFMQSHSKLMRINGGADYASNKAKLMSDPFVRDYMNKRIDQGAKSHAAMIPADVRNELVDLGVLAVLKRASECHVIVDPAGQAGADYAALHADGDAKYSTLNPADVIAEIPTLINVYVHSMSS